MRLLSALLALCICSTLFAAGGHDHPAPPPRPAVTPVPPPPPPPKEEKLKGTLAKSDAMERFQPIPLPPPGQIAYMTLRLGNVLRIPLEENGTTGYLWNVSVSNPKVLDLTASNFLLPADRGMAGVPGIRVFAFKAKALGSVVLTFKHERPWEKNRNTPEHQVVVLVVSDN